MEMIKDINKKDTIVSLVLNCLIVSLLVIGSMFAIDRLISSVYSLAGIILCFIIIQNIISNSKYYSYVIYGEIALIIMLTVLNINNVVSGLIISANNFINVYNANFNDYIKLFNINGTNNFIFMLIIYLIVTISFTHLLKRKNIIVVTILMFFVIGFSGLFYLSNNIIYLVILLLAILFNWFNAVNVNISVIKKLVIQILLVISFVGIVFTSNDYEAIKAVSDTKKNIDQTIDNIRFGEDTLPDGDLSKYNSLLDGDSKTLKLDFDNVHSVYLKGYVGSTYLGNRYDSLNKKIYYEDYGGMLDWLKGDKNFDILSQYSLFNDQTYTETKDYKLSVDNNGGNRKYVYTTYDLNKIEGNYGEYYDYNALSSNFTGTSSYTISGSYSSVDPSLLTIPSWLNTSATEYSEAESVYRYFVYENYLDISDSDKEIIDKYFYQDEIEKKDVYSLTTRIRTILSLILTYKDNPVEFDGNGDFVIWTLDNVKEGNSISYATAAMLAFRSQGIPARYVEGYFLSVEDAEKMKKDGKTEVQLTDKNAHAWVEVYIDGVGWQPIEVTPGYYTDNLPVNEVIGIPEQKPVAIDPDKEEAEKYFEMNSGDGDKNDDPEVVVTKSLAYISVIILILFFIYLLLELQRLLRLRYRNNHYSEYRSDYDLICLYSLCLGIDEEYFTHPYELVEQISSVIEIDKKQFNKMMMIIQKAIFGEYQIEAYEKRIIDSCKEIMHENTYKKLNIFKKIIYRYRYLV